MARKSGRSHRCAATRCLAIAPDTAVFCAAHQAQLTDDTRALIERLFKPAKQPSKRFLVALLRAKTETDYYERAGHRVPRAQPLPLVGADEPEEAL